MDIGYETTCPKCGYCPKDTMSENRHFVTYFNNPLTLEVPYNEGIFMICLKCSYPWNVPCEDRGQPKVLNSEGGQDEN